MNITNIELGMRKLGKQLENLTIAWGIIAVLTSAAAFAQRKVDTVVTNGKILTVDANFGIVEALAIDNGRIVARGTSAEVARYAGPNTKIIDVKGATVIPGHLG
jgi:adenine deaminase